jgi:cell division protein ZipA
MTVRGDSGSAFVAGVRLAPQGARAHLGRHAAMDLLRWALFGMGLVVVLGVYVWERRRHRRIVEARRRREAADDEGFAAELEKLSGLVASARRYEPGDAAEPVEPEGELAGRREPRLETPGEPIRELRREHTQASRPAEAEGTAPPGPVPAKTITSEPISESVSPGGSPPREPEAEEDELVIALTLMAKDGGVLAGENLRECFDEAGMVHGDMGLFHRMAPSRQGEQPLYSAANVLKPGGFDREHMDGLLTPGVALFMRLPGPAEGASTFKQFVAAAERLAARLDAEVCDAKRRPMDRRTFRAMWDRILDFEARQNERLQQSRRRGA